MQKSAMNAGIVGRCQRCCWHSEAELTLVSVTSSQNSRNNESYHMCSCAQSHHLTVLHDLKMFDLDSFPASAAKSMAYWTMWFSWTSRSVRSWLDIDFLVAISLIFSTSCTSRKEDVVSHLSHSVKYSSCWTESFSNIVTVALLN